MLSELLLLLLSVFIYLIRPCLMFAQELLCEFLIYFKFSPIIICHFYLSRKIGE